MSNDEFSISVILPNFNGRSLLESNLPALIDALKKSNTDYEIIVVDDCSSDDSVKFLEKQYPNIIIVKNTVNSGFSATCNKGVFAATKQLLCIANTDVIFTEDYFINACSSFKDPDVFSAKGKIINYGETPDQETSIDETASLYYQHGFIRLKRNVKEIAEQLNGKINGQFTLLGCCFICDRKKMLALNGYDEIFSPFYWEDSDLPLRAIEHGHKLKYIPESIIYHQTSSTISKYRSDNKRRLISARNKFIFTWRHLKGLKNWMIHIFFTSSSILVRWLALDWKYYVAFVTALYRYHSFKKSDLFTQSNNTFNYEDS